MEHTIQNALMAILASQGQHKEAQEALASTERGQWNRLVDHAIRTAPEHNRTHVAYVLKLALDDPSTGGPGIAQDFAIVAEENKCTGAMWYRACIVPTNGRCIDAGLFGPDPEVIKRRIVGLYVAREILMPEQLCICQ